MVISTNIHTAMISSKKKKKLTFCLRSKYIHSYSNEGRVEDFNRMKFGSIKKKKNQVASSVC